MHFVSFDSNLQHFSPGFVLLDNQTIVGSTSVITKNRYGWSVQNVGTLHLVNGLIVIPISVFAGWLSQYYEDRYLAIWFMAIVSLLTMCSEGLRSWGDKAAIKQMWAELRYKPTNTTYVHFFDNAEGTNNTQFFYTNVNSSGRFSEFVDVRRYCYRWRVHHLSKDHTKVLRKITDRGNIRFGLEKGFAYLFLDRYRPESETCKAMAATDPTPPAGQPEGKQPAGTGLATPPTTVISGREARTV